MSQPNRVALVQNKILDVGKYPELPGNDNLSQILDINDSVVSTLSSYSFVKNGKIHGFKPVS